MSNVTLRLKTELVAAHAITGIASISTDLYPDSQNPYVELTADQADDVLNSGFGHVFEIVEAPKAASKSGKAKKAKVGDEAEAVAEDAEAPVNDEATEDAEHY